MCIHITIALLRQNSDRWEEVVISPEDYFDLDSDEIPAVDSVPRHAHVREYFEDVPQEDVAATRVQIADSVSKEGRTITETFWNEGNNRVIERRDCVDTATDYWEIILDIEVTKECQRSEVLRLGSIDGMVQVLSHSFIQQMPDGSENEERVFPPLGGADRKGRRV